MPTRGKGKRKYEPKITILDEKKEKDSNIRTSRRRKTKREKTHDGQQQVPLSPERRGPRDRRSRREIRRSVRRKSSSVLSDVFDGSLLPKKLEEEAISTTDQDSSRLPAEQSSTSASVKSMWMNAMEAAGCNTENKKLRMMFVRNPNDAKDVMQLTAKDWQNAVKDRQQAGVGGRNLSTMEPWRLSSHVTITYSKYLKYNAEGVQKMQKLGNMWPARLRRSRPLSERRPSIMGLVHHVLGKAEDATVSTESAFTSKMDKSNLMTGATFSERVGQYMNSCRRGTIYIPLSNLQTADASSLSGSEGEELDDLEKKLDEMDEDQIEELRHKFKVMPTNMKCKKEYRRRLLAYEDMHGLGIMNDKNWMKMVKEEMRKKMANIDISIWKKSFVLIESHFGTSTVAYFFFLRWLLYLNVAIALTQVFFTLLPQLAPSHASNFSEYIDQVDLTRDSFANKAAACSLEYINRRNLANTANNGSTTDGQGLVRSLFDLIQGTGFMEMSPLFYGVYENRTRIGSDGRIVVYNMSMAYLLTTICYFVLSFLCIMKSSGTGMREWLSSDSETVHTTFTNKAFGSWDYCITDPIHARLTHKNIANDFIVDLNEKQWAAMLRNRTHKEIAKLILRRIIVNGAVLVILVLSLIAIYFGTSYSVEQGDENAKSVITFSRLLIKFLPSILTTLLNLIIPLLFEYLMMLEKYSLNMEVIILLVRTVLVRLSLVGVIIVTLYKTLITNKPTGYNYMHLDCEYGSDFHIYNHCINQSLLSECANKDFTKIMCWETHVGQQFYRLSVSDFIFTIINIIFHEFPRRWIYLQFRDTSKFVEYYLPLPFYIVYHVLDLIYCQSLCWFGAFFCPYISIWTVLKLIIYFYIKKLSLMKNCIPPVRVYRSSRSNAFFMKVLLLTFLLCSIPTGYILGNIPPSESCGPFRIYSNANHTMTSTMAHMISTFSWPIRSTIYFISSTAFILPAIIIMFSWMYYNWSVGMFNISYARQLKVDLALEGRDKLQLVKMIKDLDEQMHMYMAEDDDEDAGINTLSTKKSFTDEERAEMRNAFQMFDKDNDGVISVDELGPVMRGLGLNPTEKCLEKLIKKVDTNLDGIIDYEEYCAMLKEYTKSPEEEEEELMTAFHYFDHDKDGFISIKELIKALTVAGDKMDRKQVKQIINQFDVDGDGKLGYADLPSNWDAPNILFDPASPGHAGSSSTTGTSETDEQPVVSLLPATHQGQAPKTFDTLCNPT